jgi:hypothetical protein
MVRWILFFRGPFRRCMPDGSRPLRLVGGPAVTGIWTEGGGGGGCLSRMPLPMAMTAVPGGGWWRGCPVRGHHKHATEPRAARSISFTIMLTAAAGVLSSLVVVYAAVVGRCCCHRATGRSASLLAGWLIPGPGWVFTFPPPPCRHGAACCCGRSYGGRWWRPVVVVVVGETTLDGVVVGGVPVWGLLCGCVGCLFPRRGDQEWPATTQNRARTHNDSFRFGLSVDRGRLEQRP